MFYYRALGLAAERHVIKARPSASRLPNARSIGTKATLVTLIDFPPFNLHKLKAPHHVGRLAFSAISAPPRFKRVPKSKPAIIHVQYMSAGDVPLIVKLPGVFAKRFDSLPRDSASSCCARAWPHIYCEDRTINYGISHLGCKSTTIRTAT